MAPASSKLKCTPSAAISAPGTRLTFIAVRVTAVLDPTADVRARANNRGPSRFPPDQRPWRRDDVEDQSMTEAGDGDLGFRYRAAKSGAPGCTSDRRSPRCDPLTRASCGMRCERKQTLERSLRPSESDTNVFWLSTELPGASRFRRGSGCTPHRTGPQMAREVAAARAKPQQRADQQIDAHRRVVGLHFRHTRPAGTQGPRKVLLRLPAKTTPPPAFPPRQ